MMKPTDLVHETRVFYYRSLDPGQVFLFMHPILMVPLVLCKGEESIVFADNGAPTGLETAILKDEDLVLAWPLDPPTEAQKLALREIVRNRIAGHTLESWEELFQDSDELFFMMDEAGFSHRFLEFFDGCPHFVTELCRELELETWGKALEGD